jgi:hypothetical protein
MPKVGGKKFSYTKKGRAMAKKAKAKVRATRNSKKKK